MHGEPRSPATGCYDNPMHWLALALLLAPPDRSVVEVQRPGEPMLWALDWNAPASCPTRADVIARIRSYIPAIDEPPLQVPRARLRVDASVEQLADAWTVRLDMSGEDGSTERSFSAASCEELADAVALVAAVSLDPVVVAREIADDPPAVVAEQPVEPAAEPTNDLEPAPPVLEPSPSRLEPTPDEIDPSRDRNFQIGLRVFGGGGFGPTATGYGALGAGAALFGRLWRWSLDGGGWLPRTIRSEQAAGRFWGWWLGTRGCVVPSRRSIEFPICAGLELGQVRATGLAPALNTRAANYPWVAASIGGGVTWVIIERVAIFVDAAALVPFISGDFRVDDQTLQRLIPIGMRASLGIEVRL
jgi:hypothetical protein